MKKLLFVLGLVLLFACTTKVEEKEVIKEPEVSQWRGDLRDGYYNETDLLKVWPDSGPALLWQIDSIGNGYGSPTITSKQVFVIGEIDSISYLYAFDLKGQLEWKSTIGNEWVENYPGSRSAPTVVDDLVYVSTGLGIVACFDAKNGTQKWSHDMLSEFYGVNTRFGYSQSLLVFDSAVYFAPGGKDSNFVALNRFTGETIWIAKGHGEVPTFCSPMLISLDSIDLIITFSHHHLVAFNAANGDTVWTHIQDGQGDVHGNTPIFEDGYIYYVAGAGNRTVKLQLSKDGRSVTEVWRNMRLDNIMGGNVKIGDYLIGTGHRKQYLFRLDVNSGLIKDSIDFGRGSTIYADSMIYCYNENGVVGLIKNGNDSLEVISSFKIKSGTMEHFSHPVINNGVLYIRHGNSLMAYSIRKEE